MPKKTCVASLCLSLLLFITSPAMINYRCLYVEYVTLGVDYSPPVLTCSRSDCCNYLNSPVY